MRIRETIVAAGFISGLATTFLAPRHAQAQAVPPIALRSSTWDAVSNVTMVAGVAIVTLMPRVYYNDPEATVGWKGRWHVSMLAPALSLTALTLLVDGPIKNAIGTPRPGCTFDQTGAFPAGSTGCDSFDMPSTQSFAAWGATGAGTAIFLVDTLKYSNAKFHAGGFVGNVAVPLVLSVITSAGRAADPGGPTVFPHESVPSIVVGSLTGFVTGAVLGFGYSFLQRPNCGYGGHIICW
jgi:hypothetical protein